MRFRFRSTCGPEAWAGSCILLPVLFLFFFLIQELCVLFLQRLGGFEFQWVLAQDFQGRAAFVTTQGVALVHIFLVHVDGALAYRTSDHISPSVYRLYQN